MRKSTQYSALRISHGDGISVEVAAQPCRRFIRGGIDPGMPPGALIQSQAVPWQCLLPLPWRRGQAAPIG